MASRAKTREKISALRGGYLPTAANQSADHRTSKLNKR